MRESTFEKSHCKKYTFYNVYEKNKGREKASGCGFATHLLREIIVTLLAIFFACILKRQKHKKKKH